MTYRIGDTIEVEGRRAVILTATYPARGPIRLRVLYDDDLTADLEIAGDVEPPSVRSSNDHR